jgi:starvation-inducible DNA-binding protein
MGKSIPATGGNDRVNTGLNEVARQKIATALGPVLADTFALYLKTHTYHWNVTGPQFGQLHALFAEQYNALWLSVDDLAERIRALGFPAPGGLATFGRLSSLSEPETAPSAEEMIRDLMHGHEALARILRPVAEMAGEVGDIVTEDLMVQRIDAAEKTAWMLRVQLA